MAKLSKPRRPRAAYEKWLAEREREGLTFPQLSERTGVPASTLQEWARRLREEPAVAHGAFVEVRPVARATGEAVEVVLRSGRRLVLASARPPDGLAELVALLESC
jgi:DNA-binding IclR family transcriptional regulator